MIIVKGYTQYFSHRSLNVSKFSRFIELATAMYSSKEFIQFSCRQFSNYQVDNYKME